MRMSYLVAVSSVFFQKLKSRRDIPKDANASKDFHQGFRLCASDASLLSWCVWMVDSQSSWGRYWFAEDKKDKSISEWDCGERMNTGERLERMLTQLNRRRLCHEVKYQFIFKDFLSSYLKEKQRIFSWQQWALHVERYLRTEPSPKVSSHQRVANYSKAHF